LLLLQIINIYIVVIIGRIILSWFPISRGGLMETVYNALYTVTEPVLGPVRRALPPLGGFDLSPIVVIFGLQLVGQALAGG
jgi:YggT family protein